MSEDEIDLLTREGPPQRTRTVLKVSSISICVVSVSFLVFVFVAALTTGEVVTDGGFTNPPTSQNDRMEHVPVMIRHATIWVGNGTVLTDMDLLIQEGKISQIGKSLAAVDGAHTVNARGRVVTPGIVDMHSHIGLDSWPEYLAMYDYNERTNPITPFVRAIDGFDCEDPAIPHVRSGGVTTINVLPGSANVIGGQGQQMKLRVGARTTSNMVINDAPPIIKMAFGENPKRLYGRSQNRMPITRMGTAWLLRKAMFDARELMHKQQEWEKKKVGPRPENLELEPLVWLLNGTALLQNHCYQVHDFETMLRIGKEFGFLPTAFHHALEAYKIPDILKAHNITVATFSDEWGFKAEAYDTSVYAPAILYNEGVKMAIKSDHPVTDSKDLIFQAAKSFHWGLNEQGAIASLTSVPAEAIGLGHRIGSLELGKDGDVVIWDRYPFALGATPEAVLVEGRFAVRAETLNGDPLYPTTRPAPSPQPTMSSEPTNACSSGPLKNYAVVGGTHYTGVDLTPVTSPTLVVRDGVYDCVGTATAPCDIPAGYPTFTIGDDSVVLPALVESNAHVGQYEIGAETTTHDGSPSGSNAASVLAENGIYYQSRHTKYAWTEGVGLAIVHTEGDSLIGGQLSAFFVDGAINDTSSPLLMDNGAPFEIGQLVVFGNDGRGDGLTASISGQISYLQSALNADTAASNGMSKVKAKQIPLVVKVNQADQMFSLLRFKEANDINMVFVGGAEAHLLADQLARAKVPVILASSRPVPSEFETLRLRDDNAAVLNAAGVKVAIGSKSANSAHNLRWHAGLVHQAGLPYGVALKSITVNAAGAFNSSLAIASSIAKGNAANFVVYDGDPLSLNSHVSLTAYRDKLTCSPMYFCDRCNLDSIIH